MRIWGEEKKKKSVRSDLLICSGPGASVETAGGVCEFA